ncbi:MAG: flavodoxin-dependent (E)-4-hydroxy-3-methylbut-2-enyl-diphosphate synthase, partial [Bacteroidales bacterium]
MSGSSISSIKRFPSHVVHIGNRPLGGEYPIRLQSMTSTDTMDVKATLAQTIRIIEAGADYVRISAPNMQAAHKLKEIKAGLRNAGFSHPLIADIHFNPEVALLAARYVEKVRINPGNYIRGTSGKKTEYSDAEKEAELALALERLKPLTDVCREHGTAIRIGTNMGSLSTRIVLHYGNTPEGMVMATFEFLQLFKELDFHNLVVSLKASKPMIMVQAYEQMVDKMLQNNMSYPLHIGITEAGEGENGRIKSALGICNLLNKGIGDTLRVSLTEEPELDKTPQNSLTPDFIYTGNLPEPENNPDRKYLIDKKTATSKLTENTWLLINADDLQKSEKPPAEKYFLQIDVSKKGISLPDNLSPLPDA